MARVDSFTNLTKGWIFRFRLNASISSHNQVSMTEAHTLRMHVCRKYRVWNLEPSAFSYHTEKMLLSMFSHWLLIHIRSIPCRRETTDVMMTICVVCVMLLLDKVPLNVYGSFGHTPVITYLCWQLWIPVMTKILYHIVGTRNWK